MSPFEIYRTEWVFTRGTSVSGVGVMELCKGAEGCVVLLYNCGDEVICYNVGKKICKAWMAYERVEMRGSE